MLQKIKETFIVWIIKGVAKNEENVQTKLVRLKIDQWFKEKNMEENKKWYTSKTLWFNVLNGIAATATAMQSDTSLSPQVISVWATVTTIVNVVLRLITNQGVSK